MTVVTQVLDLAGDVVLDLNPATGWRRNLVTGPGGVIWRTSTTTSPYVDGETPVGPATRAALRRNEQLWVHGDPDLYASDEGAYWRSLEDRIDALVDAVSGSFLWRVSAGGYLWTYRTIGPADVDATGLPKEALLTTAATEDVATRAPRRPVVLAFKVQPNPTKSIPGA